jgi:hypothetical protein
MVPSALPGVQPAAELHRLTGTAPEGSTTGNSAIEFNPTPPTLPDYTRLGAQLPVSGIPTALNPPTRTGGTPEVMDLFPHWRVGYDKAFVIAPVDPQKTPFELRINGTFQARYTGFARSREFWVDSAGQTLPINNRNDIQIPRALFNISGYMYDERLTYQVFLGGSSAQQGLTLILPNIGYKADKAFWFHAGFGRIPFGAEFVIPDFTTQFVDRSMATTFFQPDFANGLWATGELTDHLKYWSMLANGVSTYSIQFTQLDNKFVLGHAFFWDAVGEYGNWIADLEYHEDLAVRYTPSFLWAPERGQPTGLPFTEANFPRLSDGTMVTQTGALAPGVTVNTFNQYGMAHALAMKYRGFSFFGEWLGQWYQGFHATGPIPKDKLNLFNNGFTVQAGCFLIPKQLEVVARSSQVYGPNGHAEEYTGGVNYYHKGNPFNTINFDIGEIVHNPAANVFTGLVPGQTGLLARLQWEVGF